MSWMPCKIWRKLSSTTAHKESFTTLETVKDKFGILSNFLDLPHQELMKQVEVLAYTLSHGEQSDLDGKELLQEFLNFPDLTSKTTLELLKFTRKNQLTEISQLVYCSADRHNTTSNSN